MVGSTTEQLESIKELIHFDHIYHKNPTKVEMTDQIISQDFNFDSDVLRIPCKEESQVNENGPSCKIIPEISIECSEPESLQSSDDDEIMIIDSIINSNPISTKQNRKTNLRRRTFTQTKKPVIKQDCINEQLYFSGCTSEYNVECFSDSGYESAESLLSPHVEHNDDGQIFDEMWENSLAELFPSLM